jgi:hypothetical protein
MTNEEQGGGAIVGTVQSTLNVMDSQAMLNPQVLEKIVQMVLARVKEHDRHQSTLAEERKMRPSMTAREAPVWEG